MRTHRGRAIGTTFATAARDLAGRARLSMSARPPQKWRGMHHTRHGSSVQCGAAAKVAAASTPAPMAAKTVAAKVVASMRAARRATKSWRRMWGPEAHHTHVARPCANTRSATTHSAAEVRKARKRDREGVHREPSRLFSVGSFLCTAHSLLMRHAWRASCNSMVPAREAGALSRRSGRHAHLACDEEQARSARAAMYSRAIFQIFSIPPVRF